MKKSHNQTITCLIGLSLSLLPVSGFSVGPHPVEESTTKQNPANLTDDITTQVFTEQELEEHKGYIILAGLDLLLKKIPVDNTGVLYAGPNLEEGDISGREVVVFLNTEGKCLKYVKQGIPSITAECSSKEASDFQAQREELALKKAQQANDNLKERVTSSTESVLEGVNKGVIDKANTLIETGGIEALNNISSEELEVLSHLEASMSEEKSWFMDFACGDDEKCIVLKIATVFAIIGGILSFTPITGMGAGFLLVAGGLGAVGISTKIFGEYFSKENENRTVSLICGDMNRQTCEILTMTVLGAMAVSVILSVFPPTAPIGYAGLIMTTLVGVVPYMTQRFLPYPSGDWAKHAQTVMGAK